MDKYINARLLILNKNKKLDIDMLHDRFKFLWDQLTHLKTVSRVDFSEEDAFRTSIRTTRTGSTDFRALL